MRAQVRVVGNAAQVALEQAMVGRIEPHQRDEQADVGLGETVAEQDDTVGQKGLHLVVPREDWSE